MRRLARSPVRPAPWAWKWWSKGDGKLQSGSRRIPKSVDRAKFYALDEAVKLVKNQANAKFDETVEISMNLGVDPRHADQMVRGVCNLPNGSGRKMRVGVFAKGAKAEEAKKAGADVVGAEDLVEIVSKGTIDFDRCIATPDMMGLVGRLGKVSGPARHDAEPEGWHRYDGYHRSGQSRQGWCSRIPRRKGGIVQAGIGKASFSEDQIAGNIRAFVDAVLKAKPQGAKGTFVKKVSISSTMGPGLKLDLASITNAA